MGVLQNPLGINLGSNMPIINSPFNNSDTGNIATPPPPGSEFMITETGDFMITQSSLDFMITE